MKILLSATRKGVCLCLRNLATPRKISNETDCWKIKIIFLMTIFSAFFEYKRHYCPIDVRPYVCPPFMPSFTLLEKIFLVGVLDLNKREKILDFDHTFGHFQRLQSSQIGFF